MTQKTSALATLALALAATATFAPAASAQVTPRAGYYSFYEFDCQSPCGGAYGTWEVDLTVDPGGEVARFTHVGAKCNARLAPGYTWSGSGKAAEVSRSATSVSKTVRIQRKRYTISTRLRWTSPRKARGWVQVEGPGCNAGRKRFTVVAG